MHSGKYYVSLAHGVGVAGLRAITGAEEHSIESSNSLEAIDLVNSLLVDTPLTTVKPGSAMDLPISERDTLLASIYIDLFGAVIENNIACEFCEEKFELNFSLLEIQKTQKSMQLETFQGLGSRLQMNSDNSYTLDGGSENEISFRLPTGNDEVMVLQEVINSGNPSLRQSCILAGAAEANTLEVEGILEKIAPFLDLDVMAVCPECEGEHTFFFNLQDYLLMKLCVERSNLQQQIHALAINYNWPLEQILRLPRRDRMSLYQLTLNEPVMP